MAKLIVGRNAAQQLIEANEDDIEVCDPDNNRLGYFLSEKAYLKIMYRLAHLEVTTEELWAADNEEGGRTLPEIMEDLKSRFPVEWNEVHIPKVIYAHAE